MFDIGFWELSIIMIVALLVIGPERLPGIARKAGILVGKARRMVQSVKDDIDKELAAEELRNVIAKHKNSASAFDILDEDTRETISDSVNVAKKQIEEARSEYLVKSAPDETDTDKTTPDVTSPDDEQQQKRIS